MLMKWEDLLPGDILTINPEFVKRYRYEIGMLWICDFINVSIEIANINVNESNINIYMKKSIGFNKVITIFKDGCLYNKPIPFFIVKHLTKEN